MDLTKYDDLIATILEEEKQIYPFLDVIFGFLWRKTDFFVVQKQGSKIGFPSGGAEKIILSVFRKWQKLLRSGPTKSSASKNETFQIVESPECVSVIQEEVVVTSLDNVSLHDISSVSSVQNSCDGKKTRKDIVSSSDIYNGADRGTYRWSQTIGDLEILVPVPEYVKKSKDVNVCITDTSLSVKVKHNCDTSKLNILVDGVLSFKVKKEESIWSLLPGQHISIHCEKIEERWWDALLTCEPKLDTRKLDASRPMADLTEEDQMKIEELMWNEEQKQLGLKTSDQIKAEKILKDAWNVEGSPFKGTEFDPSLLNFDSNNMNINFQGNG